MNKIFNPRIPEGIPHGISKALEINNFDKFITVLGDNFVFGEKFLQGLKLFS